MDIVQAVIPALLKGAGITLQTAIQAGLLAILISVVVGVFRDVGGRSVHFVLTVYVEFFQARLLSPRRRLLILDELHLVLFFTDISDNIVLAVAHINYKLMLPALILLFGPIALCHGYTTVNVKHQVTSCGVL